MNIYLDGGEFIAGNKENLLNFINICVNIYDEMKVSNFITINGDEFIESVAAWKMRDKIKSANAYVFRYWTAYRWHYVCTNFVNNPVAVLHCPREKDHGFVKLYSIMKRGKRLPNIKNVYRILHLDVISYIIRRVSMKLL